MLNAAFTRSLLALGCPCLLAGIAAAQPVPDTPNTAELSRQPAIRVALATTLADDRAPAGRNEVLGLRSASLARDASGVSALLVAPAINPARRPRSRAQRGALAVSGLYAAGRLRFAESHQFTKYQDPDAGRLQMDYEHPAGAGLGVDARVTLWRSLGLQAGYSRLRRNGSVQLSADIPHPLEFNRGRSVTHAANDLVWQENAVHFGATCSRSIGPVRATAFAGASFVSVRADLVEKLTFKQAYPFDAENITIESMPNQRISKNATGPDIGAAFDWPLLSHIALGATVRYSGAVVTLAHPQSTAAPDEDKNVLGMQVLRPTPSVSTKVDTRALRLALGLHLLF